MAENNQNVTDVMDKDQTEPKTKNDDLDNEPENAQDSQKKTLTVFKKAKRSRKVRTGFIVGLAGFTGFIIGCLTGGKSKKEPTTEEVIDAEPEEETAE